MINLKEKKRGVHFFLFCIFLQITCKCMSLFNTEGNKSIGYDTGILYRVSSCAV